jgi:hypothetical protein
VPVPFFLGRRSVKREIGLFTKITCRLQSNGSSIHPDRRIMDMMEARRYGK